MKWHEVDYHGSRSYQRDRPAIKRTSLVLSWLAMVVRERLRRLASPTAPSTVLLHDGKRSFSLLGASAHSNLSDRERKCPFPTTVEAAQRPVRAVSTLRHED